MSTAVGQTPSIDPRQDVLDSTPAPPMARGVRPKAVFDSGSIDQPQTAIGSSAPAPASGACEYYETVICPCTRTRAGGGGGWTPQGQEGASASPGTDFRSQPNAIKLPTYALTATRTFHSATDVLRSTGGHTKDVAVDTGNTTPPPPSIFIDCSLTDSLAVSDCLT